MAVEPLRRAGGAAVTTTQLFLCALPIYLLLLLYLMGLSLPKRKKRG